MKKLNTSLYFITDSAQYDETEFLHRIEEALKGGVTLVQLREKEKTTNEYIKLAKKVHIITKNYNVPLIIDDRVDVALAVDAEGVHVGTEDIAVSEARRLMGQGKIVGATAKTVQRAREAYEQGADYLGVGAIFPTTTKVKTVITSIQTLQDICNAVPIPVNAIGGLNSENIDILKNIPIAGICVVSAIMKANEPQKAAALLRSKIESMSVRKVLSIAGTDPIGGAGIQADLKTMTMNGVYAMSAITAMVAQNTMGVTAIQESQPEFLKKQLDAVFEDIYPDAIKIGMVSSSELIRVIADRLRFYEAKKIVLDPVMVATAGSSLIKTDAIETMVKELLPLATVITPNIPEAEILSDTNIRNTADMEKAAIYIADKYNCAVLLKGGHSINDANDLLYSEGKLKWFSGKRIDNPNTHGTGCTLSSAIAANLAKGCSLEQAVLKSKNYISETLNTMLNIGRGSGPMMHNYILKEFV